MMFPETRTILSLFDYSGSWSLPYRRAGYDVVQIDIKHGEDVRLLKKLDKPVYGVLAAPPCTHLASSGARWWRDKGDKALLDSLALVDAAMRIIMVHQPVFWCIENPVGRLVHYLGEPVYSFDPCDFGDAYTKRTLLWGEFNAPVKRPVFPRMGSYMHTLPQSPERAALRSITPPGFARAFFEANSGNIYQSGVA